MRNTLQEWWLRRRLVTIARAERTLRACKDREIAVVFDRRGKYLFHVVGNIDEVTFTREQETFLPGVLVMHNHPGNSSFSVLDVEVASRFQFAELRVISQEYRYRMLPGEAGWNEEYYWEVVETARLKHEQAVRLEKLALPPVEYNRDFSHAVWERVAKEAGLRYTRETW